jgi:NAD(P)-dependent dehydrogenase (short-subunit alcohol dehydrogenase family)
MPRLHRYPARGEVADLQAPGVDVSKAAIATARGRTGTPVEVAQAALFPASDAASFGNGAHLFVGNGFAAG